MPETEPALERPTVPNDPRRRIKIQGGDAKHIIAIIGAGFSGTMAAIHLRRELPPNYIVYLFERTGRFARGLAYAVSGTPHLLNVRSMNMSAFPEDPGNFERWIEQEAGRFPGEIKRTNAGTFATRRLYGRYLRGLLYEEMKASGSRVRLVADDVIALEHAPAGWQLTCASGRDIKVSGLVLAAGNLPSSRPCDGVVFHDPWTQSAISGLRPDEPVLIVGTGLTMIDLALGMQGQGFRGPIVAVSRRGLVPQRHDQVEGAWPTPEFTDEQRRSLAALLHRLRAEVREAKLQGIGWRAVVDGLRPITAELWRGLSRDQRSRFLRHLRPYWDIHRHRMAPPVAEQVEALIESGSLRIKRGRVHGIRALGDRASVTLQDRKTGSLETLTAQRVIFATGIEAIAAGDGLIARILDAGIARTDPQGLGLEVTEALEIIGRKGVPARRLWALGPIVRGIFWECLAVPDIRVQAHRIAVEVAQRVCR